MAVVDDSRRRNYENLRSPTSTYTAIGGASLLWRARSCPKMNASMRIISLRGVLPVAAMAAALVGCNFGVDYQEGLKCGPKGECPPGQRCSQVDNLCHKQDQTPGTSRDAGDKDGATIAGDGAPATDGPSGTDVPATGDGPAADGAACT